MWSPLLDGLHFLVNTLFTLYLFVLLLRVLLPAVGADYYNSFSQLIIKFTQPLIAPLQSVLPRSNRVDTAAIIILLLFTCLKNWILLSWLLSAPVFWLGLVLLSIAQILEMAIQLYFFAIIILVIMSWVQPNSYNTFVTILFQLTEPLLMPVRRFLPPIGALDLSPLIILLVLQLISIMLVSPFITFSLQLTVGMLR